MKFSFGSDPEFIIIDEKGKLKSAIEIIKKSKEKKLKIGNSFYFYDNVLAECTIEPAHDRQQVIDNIRNCLKNYKDLISPYKLSLISAGHYEDKELKHKDSRKSGCAVEFCAYKLKDIKTTKANKIIKKSNLRTAGGHVHLGTDLGKDYDSCIMLIRMLDLFLGVSCLLVDNCPYSQKRRTVYGQAGRYRRPKYGVEYRTLGNFWFASPELVGLVFDICSVVLELTEQRVYEEFWTVDHEQLNSDEFWNSGGDPSCCHTCHGYDTKLLRSLFKMQKQELLEKGKPIFDLLSKYLPTKIVKKVEEFSNKKFDMYEEWCLN